MKIINVLTVKETVSILREHGMSVSEVHLRAGLECGVYPFGVSIKSSWMKTPVFEIYKPLLMRWIDERSEEEEAA